MVGRPARLLGTRASPPSPGVYLAADSSVLCQLRLSQLGPGVASDVVLGALSLISAAVIRDTGTSVPGPTGR